MKFLLKWFFPPLGVTITVTPELNYYGVLSYRAEALIHGELFYVYSYNKRVAVKMMKERIKKQKAMAKHLEAGPEKFDV